MPEDTTAPQSGADILKRIKPRLRIEKTAIVMRPDLLHEWEDLNDDLSQGRQEEAAAGPPGRLGDKPDIGDRDPERPGRLAKSPEQRERAEKNLAIARRIDELEAEIEATKLIVTFRAMAKPDYQALCEKHPPRKDSNLDQIVGFNQDAVNEALVRACMIDPVFEDCHDPECDHEDCGTWQQFERVLNPSEWDELQRTVNLANSGVREAPKSFLAAAVLSRHAADSAQPETGESAPSDSTAGSPESFTNTTTETASPAR